MNKIFSPDYLLPIIAIIVSIFSLGYSVYQSRITFRLTQEHNKKSVEPILSTLYKTELISSNDKKSLESFEIKNCGFGPAILKSFILIKDNKAYNNMFDIYKQIIGTPQYDADSSMVHTMENIVIASNETVTIFKFYFKKSSAFPEVMVFHELAKEVSLKVEFETFYGEKRSYDIESITV